MTLTDNQIAYRLKNVRDELADPKWSTWYYVENGSMTQDLQYMVQELDRLIGVLNDRTRS